MLPIGPAGRDGYQQLFDATLVGADRTKDLAVVQISAPKVLAQVNECSTMVNLTVSCIAVKFGADQTRDLAVVQISAPKVPLGFGD
jgi:hypothetical protein